MIFIIEALIQIPSKQARSQDFEMGGQPWILLKQGPQSGRHFLDWFLKNANL